MSFSGAMIQNAIYIAQQPPEWPVSADDWDAAAREKLDDGAYGYIAGGAGAEQTGYVQYGIVVFRFEGDRIAERWSAYMSAA